MLNLFEQQKLNRSIKSNIVADGISFNFARKSNKTKNISLNFFFYQYTPQLLHQMFALQLAFSIF